MGDEINALDDQMAEPDNKTKEQDNNSSSDTSFDFLNPADFLAEKVVHKRRALTLKQKAEIIEAYYENPSISKVELARRFNLSRTTLHSIVAKRDAIAESMKKFGSYSSMRKKSRTSPFQEIEGKLLLWMEYAKDLGLPVNGFTLRRQAMAIAKDLGVEKFTASNGWIERFKSRHNDCWKACKGSGVPKQEKTDNIPLEPTVEIKEEPVDYYPTPSTSTATNPTASEEFILPHEDHTWTTPNAVVEPQFTLSVASLGSASAPHTSDSEPPSKKRKVNDSKITAHVPPTNGPTTSSEGSENNFGELSNPGSSKSKDQFDVFGEYIAAKLRDLDRVSCAFTQKAIADLIFEAEMGKYLNQTESAKS